MDAVTADLKRYEEREEAREAAYDEAKRNRKKIVAWDLEVRERGSLEDLMAEVVYLTPTVLTDLVKAAHKSLHYEEHKEALIRAALALVLAMEGQADRMWGGDLVEEAAQTILENRRVPPTRCDD